MDLSTEEKKEIRQLGRLAAVTILWLFVLLVWPLAVVVQVLLLAMEPNALTPNPTLGVLGDLVLTRRTQEIVLCVFGGTLGSAVAALLSIVDRYGNGWELNSGRQYPEKDEQAKEDRRRKRPKERFNARLVPSFVVRPFLGSAMGLLVYTGLLGGYLIATQDTAEKDFSLPGLVFLSCLAGLFAKTFLEKLKDVFKALVGK